MDLLGKGLGDIKRHLMFHNVVTSPAELVRHRFDSHNRMALRFLFLIEAFDPRIKADRKVGGLHKRPSQILVAVFGVAAPFTFAVADFLAPHTPPVGSWGHPLDGRSRGNDSPQEINFFISVSSTRLSGDL
jgi:hypothetical protein